MKKSITLLLLLFVISTQAQGFGDFDDYDYEETTESDYWFENKEKGCKDHHWNGVGNGHAGHIHCDDDTPAAPITNPILGIGIAIGILMFVRKKLN